MPASTPNLTLDPNLPLALSPIPTPTPKTKPRPTPILTSYLFALVIRSIIVALFFPLLQRCAA
jgi:hypothetical protein